MPVTSRRSLVACKLTCQAARKSDKLLELDSLYADEYLLA